MTHDFDGEPTLLNVKTLFRGTVESFVEPAFAGSKDTNVERGTFVEASAGHLMLLRSDVTAKLGDPPEAVYVPANPRSTGMFQHLHVESFVGLIGSGDDLTHRLAYITRGIAGSTADAAPRPAGCTREIAKAKAQRLRGLKAQSKATTPLCAYEPMRLCASISPIRTNTPRTTSPLRRIPAPSRSSTRSRNTRRARARRCRGRGRSGRRRG